LEKARLTVFPTRSPAGNELSDWVRCRASELGYEVTVVSDPSQDDVFEACTGDGGILYDATIEPDGDSNYPFALYALINSPYSIIASRSYLPLNFGIFLDTIAPPYPQEWDNTRIKRELEMKLEELCGRLPKSVGESGVVDLDDMSQSLLDRADHLRQDDASIFISYRGSFEDQAVSLAQRVADERGQHSKLFRSDELAFSDEILSLQRRWEILRVIWRWIYSSSEFWIFDSSGYLDSWWTRGELVSLAFTRGHKRPLVRVFDPATNTIGEPTDKHVPSLSKRQHKRLGRWFLVAGMPEMASRLRELASHPILGRLFGLMDPAFSHSFAQDVLLQCRGCTSAGSWGTKSAVDDFLWSRSPSMQTIADGEIHRALELAPPVVVCPQCGVHYEILLGPPRYWWYPVRNGIGTGPDGACLEQRPVFRTRMIEETEGPRSS
jgi:hypothetical protein